MDKEIEAEEADAENQEWQENLQDRIKNKQ